MDINILLSILISTFVLNVIYIVVGLLIFLKYHRWKTGNPLDIVIAELTRNGVVIRKEIGRREISKTGWRVVTAKWLKKSSVKDNLGYNISEDDMSPSGHGRKRKFLLVAMKDGLTSSLQNIEGADKWTKEEKEILLKIEETFNTASPIKLNDIPKTLSLKPILSEQTRLAIDLARDTVDVEGNDDKKAARRMMLAAAGVFIFAILISFALLVVVITQGQTLAGAEVAPAAVTSIAGLPLPG